MNAEHFQALSWLYHMGWYMGRSDSHWDGKIPPHRLSLWLPLTVVLSPRKGLHLFGHCSGLTYRGCQRRQWHAPQVGDEADAGRAPDWWHRVMALMRWRGEWGPLLESRGSQLAFLAQRKDIAALAASISPLSQKPGFTGPVCARFASLGAAVTCRVTGEIGDALWLFSSVLLL